MMDIPDIIARHPARRDALLPILHDIQRAFDHIPPAAVPAIADALNLSRADVHGVVSFYHDFRREPATKPVVKLCRAEACQARGVAAVAAVLESDDRIQLDTVYCLGLCASGPSAMVGMRVYGRLDPEKARQLANEASA